MTYNTSNRAERVIGFGLNEMKTSRDRCVGVYEE